MSLDLFPLRCSEPELTCQVVCVQGNTSSTPTEVVGFGSATTWFATGKLRITFSDYQGAYAGSHCQIDDTNPDTVKGFTVHCDKDSYSATTKAMDVWIYNASQALADPATTTFLTITLYFTR